MVFVSILIILSFFLLKSRSFHPPAFIGSSSSTRLNFKHNPFASPQPERTSHLPTGRSYCLFAKKVSSGKKKGFSRESANSIPSTSSSSEPLSTKSNEESTRSNERERAKIDLPMIDPSRGPFQDIDPDEEDLRSFSSDDILKSEETRIREIRLQKLRQQALMQEGLTKIKFGSDGDVLDPDKVAMEEARERADRVRNRVDEQIQLMQQLNQIDLEKVTRDGKEYWIHPIYKELGISLPNSKGRTDSEFDLIDNLRQIQSTFMGLRPTPIANNNNGEDSSLALSSSSSSSDSQFLSEESDFDEVFRSNSTAKQFTKYYPYGYYDHIPGLTLKSPFDVFGNLYPQPSNYYKLLPTLDAFRLTQEFWRQLFDREEDLVALWYAEDYRKEQEMKEAPWWKRAIIFGLDNDDGTDQTLEDKIAKYCEALLWGALFMLFLNFMIALSNGLMNYVFRQDFLFFFENEWWKMPLKEVLPHLPRFEDIQSLAPKMISAASSAASSPLTSPLQ